MLRINALCFHYREYLLSGIFFSPRLPRHGVGGWKRPCCFFHRPLYGMSQEKVFYSALHTGNDTTPPEIVPEEKNAIRYYHDILYVQHSPPLDRHSF